MSSYYRVNTISTSNNSHLSAMLTLASDTLVVEAENELDLIRKVQSEKCAKSLDQLCKAHLRFIASRANKLNGYGIDMSELIQEGSVGLIEAIERFDTESGYRLNTFADHYIRSRMNAFITQNVDIMKIVTTKEHKKLFFNLRKMKKGQHLTQNLAAEIAGKLNVSVKDVYEMDMRLSAKSPSFDTLTEDKEDTPSDASTYLFNPSDDVESIVIEQMDSEKARKKMHAAIKNLPPREQDIIQSRWLNEEKTPLRELSDRYNVSKERIRQIESRSFELIEHAMTSI